MVIKEKMKNLKDAMAINSLDGVEPTDFAKALYLKYANGELEAEEVTKKLIKKYKEK